LPLEIIGVRVLRAPFTAPEATDAAATSSAQSRADELRVVFTGTSDPVHHFETQTLAGFPIHLRTEPERCAHLGHMHMHVGPVFQDPARRTPRKDNSVYDLHPHALALAVKLADVCYPAGPFAHHFLPPSPSRLRELTLDDLDLLRSASLVPDTAVAVRDAQLIPFTLLRENEFLYVLVSVRHSHKSLEFMRLSLEHLNFFDFPGLST
jgi:hypothetical protein